jgi:dTDP-4-amino-4,6-dideoxygalactose transaminase
VNRSRLAILGGRPAIPRNVGFRSWPPITKLDERLVLASLRQDKHAWGPHCVALQEEFARWNGNRFCMPTNSGTAALHMALAACGVEAGDEVITTSLSWTSTATCIIHHNAIPVFVDVEWDSMHLDPARVEAAITRRTKAILPVHYWGVACDMDPILRIARRHKLAVVEDACQAHGALYKGKKVGTLGDVASFSFNQNKNLCGGEGGVLVTDDEEKFKLGRRVVSFGEMRPAHSGRFYDPAGLGWMYRTSDLPAAFALAQLRRLDENTRRSQRNWHRLHEGLAGTPHLLRPYTSKARPTTGYAYVLRTEKRVADARGVGLRALTDGVVEALRAEGLPCNPARWVLPGHTVFQTKDAYGKGSPWTDGHSRKDISYDLEQYPVAQACADSSIWIGVNTHRPPNGSRQVDAVIAAVRKVYEHLDRVPIPKPKPVRA